MFKKICLNLSMFAVALVLFATPTYAATYYLSPASGSPELGSTYAVQLKLDTKGQPIDTVDVYMSYPKDLMDVSYVTQSSTFSLAPEKTASNGGIHLSLGAVNGTSGQLTVANGNVTVATIGFKPKALGTASVSIGTNSVALSHTDGSNQANGFTGGSYTIVPAKPKTPAPASILSGIQVTNIATNGATLSWTTSQLSDSLVEYGGDQSHYAGHVNSAKLSTSHSLTIADSTLMPGMILHYKVSSKDASGNTQSSTDSTIHLKGYKVIIELDDPTGKPIPGLKVSVKPDVTDDVTDEQGQASFTDVTPEQHTVNITGDNFQRSSSINVALVPDFITPQTFKITVDAAGLSALSKKQESSLFGIDIKILAGVILGLILLIAIIIFIIKKKNDRFPSQPGGGGSSSDPTPPSVVSSTPTVEPTVVRS